MKTFLNIFFNYYKFPERSIESVKSRWRDVTRLRKGEVRSGVKVELKG